MNFIVQPSSFVSVLCFFFFFHVPCFSQRKTSNDRIPGQVEFSCPEEFGYYPHPNDCTQYYVCVFGGAVLESCTGGLMYSHELQTCDWPRNVGCEGVDSVFADEQAIKQQQQQLPQRSKFPPSAPPRAPPKQRDELLTKPLYEEEELGPAQEIENDRQQRVYRGQPPTLGQVARDRDGIAKHANALQTSSGVKQHAPFQYRTNIASPQNSQQAYIQQPTSSPSYNFSSAINQFSQQQQPTPQPRPQQNFDTSYYNLYDDDDFFREDDYAQQFQNQNSAKLREQEDRQASQQDQRKKQNQQQQRQQQNNLYNPASQDYKEQYFLQNADQDNRYEQPSKAVILNATSTYSANPIKPNNSSHPRLSFSFEQTPQPASQRSNQFTIPESQHIVKPFPFSYEKPSSNKGHVFRNLETSLQQENTLPVVQLFEQEKPLRQHIENRKQTQSNEPVENNERKYLIRPDNVNRNTFENQASKANFRNEQRDPKRIGQVRIANEGFMSGLKESIKNENFRIVVDDNSSTFKPTQRNNIRFNPTTPTQPRLFSSRDDTLNQPSKIEYVTKVPQLSWEYSKNINETIKQRLNSALIGTALRDTLDSEKESSTSRFNTMDFKQSAISYNNSEWRNRAPNQVYLSDSTRSESSQKSPFEISTEGVVIRTQNNNLEDSYRQSLASTNIYTRPTTPSNSFKYADNKRTASINTFTQPSTPISNTDNSNYRQSLNQFNKATIQVPKQKQIVKPWKFNVDNKQVIPEDADKSNSKILSLSQEKSTVPSTSRSNVTPYTPYNYIKQLTTLNNNDIRGSTYRQQSRPTTPVPTSSRDFKEQQTKAHQIKVTADRARVQEQNSQINGWSKVSEVTRFIEPTTMRFPTESNKFKLSKPAEGIKNNFVDSVSYSNATDDDSEEYYYDDDLEEYEDKLPDVISPPSLPSPPPTKTSTTRTTTVRNKPEPVRTLAPSRIDVEKCLGSECNEKPLVRVRPTTSANQTTPILPSRGRVRGSATYTTASPEAEKPSSGGARSRPTLKPSQSIVSKAVTEFVDIYKYPPSRPDPVYPTPTPDKTAAKCRKDVCLLPDCYCGGKDIPADLPVEETPQIVLLTFDDSVNDLNKGLYADLFEKGRTNPNGCPISATFYVSHEWTDYSQVQNLYANGHEMASHTVSHSFGEQFSQKKWTREIAGQREILAAYGGVRLEDIRGMRAPFLAVGGNKMFKMLYDSNFTYDSSMPVYENRPPSWPYTLDYKIFHDCMIPPCPTRSYPGVWEVPMVMWQDLNGGRCSMGDACSNPPDADGVYKMLIKNFERHFTTNRAPFGLYYHAAWFTQAHHKEGFINFLDTIVAMPEVWVVTNWQALQWVRDPTPMNRLNSFQPFSCDYPERPKKCNNPKVCNLWHKSGVRYMRTCQPCPEIYPWTGLSGIKNSRVDNEIINE